MEAAAVDDDDAVAMTSCCVGNGVCGTLGVCGLIKGASREPFCDECDEPDGCDLTKGANREPVDDIDDRLTGCAPQGWKAVPCNLIGGTGVS